MNELHIAPNRPVIIALIDPEGVYDHELNRGTYQTTAGETLVLPRPAVIALNMYGPGKGEEIEITQTWTGAPGDRPEWSVRSAAEAASEPAAREEASAPPAPPIEPIRAPTPIRRPRQEDQPRLFDTGKGTGTYGPMPGAVAYAAPHVASRKNSRPTAEPIPANVAFREITRFVFDGLQANGLQWGVDAQQAMVCTVMIAEYKAGRIGPWERGK